MKYWAIGGLFAALFLAGNAWPQGVITQFAGSPFIFTGNGQPAVNAPLGNIYGITLDPAENVVIADYGNCLVERINPDGYAFRDCGEWYFSRGAYGGRRTSRQCRDQFSLRRCL